jgi:hypothetical protein
MDISTQIEITLREADFDTWLWTSAEPNVICFENAVLIGFVHIFSSAENLLERWEAAQASVLSRHSPALRAAGLKAWNVYSVFLTAEPAPNQQRAVERIEENFSQTRKIARTGVRTQEDVVNALLPLTTMKAQPILSDTDFEDRLRSRLSTVPKNVLTAFLSDVPAEDIAKILLEKS